jgi:hypothetical protein
MAERLTFRRDRAAPTQTDPVAPNSSWCHDHTSSAARLKASQVVVVEPSQCQCCIEATLLPNSGGTTSLVFTHRPPAGPTRRYVCLVGEPSLLTATAWVSAPWDGPSTCARRTRLRTFSAVQTTSREATATGRSGTSLAAFDDNEIASPPSKQATGQWSFLITGALSFVFVGRRHQSR